MLFRSSLRGSSVHNNEINKNKFFKQDNIIYKNKYAIKTLFREIALIAIFLNTSVVPVYKCIILCIHKMF